MDILFVTQVVFEAQKRPGVLNDIALDDISIEPGSCGEGPPEPTHVPPPVTPPPMPGNRGSDLPTHIRS